MSQAVVREISDSARFERAVMFTDIFGFTRLMKEEEESTIQKLESHRQQLEVLHEINEGRVIQYYGDGSLSVFSSPSQAIECAMAIQKNVQRLQLPLKIAIHWGEVVEKGGAVYGDAVNVTSRIESVGVADSILISDGIWKAVRDKGFQAKSLGSLRFKNVNTPIKIYGLVADNLKIPNKNQLEGKLAPDTSRGIRWIMSAAILVFVILAGVLWQRNATLNAMLDDEITTVGVMPFQAHDLNEVDDNVRMGLMENLVSNLSSFYGLQVLSPRATETYDHSNRQPTDIGAELGVSHLLYVTMRPDENDSIRIHMELVGTRNGRSIWAKTLYATTSNLFSQPTSVPQDLADFLQARENPYETNQVESRSTTLSSYRLLMESRQEAKRETESGMKNATRLLELAVERDSSFALGYAVLATYYTQMHMKGFLPAEPAQENAEKNVGQAFLHDRNLAEAYTSNALFNYVFFLSGPQEILELLQQAVQLRPSSDYSYYLMGKVYYDLSDYELANNYFSLAIKLNPDQPEYRIYRAKALAAWGKSKEADAVLKEAAGRFENNQSVLLAQIELNAVHQGAVDQINWNNLTNSVDKRISQALVLVLEGNMDEARQLLDEVDNQFPDAITRPVRVLLADREGNRPEVWHLLDEAVVERETWLKELKQMPLSNAITMDSKFTEICRSVLIDELSD